jgi:hypothetical protein
MKPVNSSNITAVGYDPASKTLAVQFKSGGTYHYQNVTPEKHGALMSASSIGGHLHTHIKPHHKATKQ